MTRRYLFLLLLALAFLNRVAVSQEGKESMLHAGAAAVNVTPNEFPLNMPGGFNANIADAAHDPLHARAIVLATGDERSAVAIVVVDNLGVDPAAIEAAKQIASRDTGIPAERMMLCSTHTHSAPASGTSNSESPEGRYRQLLIKGIADAIANAHDNLQPASAGWAVEPLPDEVRNRRWYLKPGKMPLNPFGQLDQVKMNPGYNPAVLDRPAGPIDPDITILSLHDQKNRPLALLANYSLHYVGGIPRGQVSADYFGEFARLVPVRLRAPSNFVAMMSNGTSGDINNLPFLIGRPPRAPFEQVQVVATKAADTVWRAHNRIDVHQKKMALDMTQRTVRLQYRRPSDSEIAAAKKVIATNPDEQADLPRLAVPYAKRTLAAANRKEDYVDVKLQALRVGDLVICGIPFETFVEIGLELKQHSPFGTTMVIGLANGRYGYLPTPRQHRLGGYETWLGTNHVQKDASPMLVEQLVEMMQELHAAK